MLPSSSSFSSYYSKNYVSFYRFLLAIKYWGNSGLDQSSFHSQSLISYEFHPCPWLQLPPHGRWLTNSSLKILKPVCLPDISMRMCQRLLKCSLSKSELSISPKKLFFFQDSHLHEWWPHPPTFKQKIQVSSSTSLSPGPLLSTLSLITAIISLEYLPLVCLFAPHHQYPGPHHLPAWDYWSALCMAPICFHCCKLSKT